MVSDGGMRFLAQPLHINDETTEPLKSSATADVVGGAGGVRGGVRGADAEGGVLSCGDGEEVKGGSRAARRLRKLAPAGLPRAACHSALLMVRRPSSSWLNSFRNVAWCM